MARCIADDAFASAYDALAPEERALIKTAVARIVGALASCSCPEVSVVSSRKSMRQGVSLYEETRPADWAAILWDGAYGGWPRILAALLPAILAGVPDCLACRVGAAPSDGPLPDAVLAAMELAGQELVADVSLDDAFSLLTESAERGLAGRVVLLGADAGFDALAAKAARLGLFVRREAAPVRIAVEEGLSSSALRFAHQDAVFVPHDEAGGPFAAMYCGPERFAGRIVRSPLVLTPGQESFWVWQDIDMAFFQETSRALAACSR